MDLYVYASIALFGFLFIVLSFLMGEIGHVGDIGGHDIHLGDLGHEAHLGDAGHAAHLGDAGSDGDPAENAPGPFSTRVLSVFLTTFGTVATAARLSGFAGLTSAALGIAAGYALGWGTWRLMRLLWAQGGSSHVRAQDFVGCEGEVSVAIPASGPGQVACIANGVRSYQIARSTGGGEIPLGTPVRIVSVSAEGVVVEAMAGEPSPRTEDPQRRMHHA